MASESAGLGTLAGYLGAHGLNNWVFWFSRESRDGRDGGDSSQPQSGGKQHESMGRGRGGKHMSKVQRNRKGGERGEFLCKER